MNINGRKEKEGEWEEKKNTKYCWLECKLVQALREII